MLSVLARREVAKNTTESFEKAAEYLSKSIRNEQASTGDFALLAQLESRANKHSEAIAVLKAGMWKNPYSPELAEALAAEYVKIDDYKSGRELIRRSLELFPDDKPLRGLAKQIESATLDPLNPQ